MPPQVDCIREEMHTPLPMPQAILEPPAHGGVLGRQSLPRELLGTESLRASPDLLDQKQHCSKTPQVIHEHLKVCMCRAGTVGERNPPIREDTGGVEGAEAARACPTHSTPGNIWNPQPSSSASSGALWAVTMASTH